MSTRKTVCTVFSKFGENGGNIRIRCPELSAWRSGPGGARNTGIEAATGDYLLFVDADDWLAPDAVEYLVNVVRERQSDIVRFGKVDAYENHETRKPIELKKRQYGDGWESFKDSLAANRFSPACWNNIYKKDLILTSNIRFPERLLYEDMVFTFKAHMAAKSIFCADRYFYYWRRAREGSRTYAANPEDTDICTVLELLDDYLLRSGRQDILHSIEYDELMFTWVTGTIFYRSLKSANDTKTKDAVMRNIAFNPSFRKHARRLVMHRRTKAKVRLPAILLLSSLLAFKVAAKVFFRIRSSAPGRVSDFSQP